MTNSSAILVFPINFCSHMNVNISRNSLNLQTLLQKPWHHQQKTTATKRSWWEKKFPEFFYMTNSSAIIFFQFDCYAPIHANVQISTHSVKLDRLSQETGSSHHFYMDNFSAISFFPINCVNIIHPMSISPPTAWIWRWCHKHPHAKVKRMQPMNAGVKKNVLQIFCMTYSSANFYFTMKLFCCNPHQFPYLPPQPEFEEIITIA
jgi:hypothetical protein